MDEAGVTFVKLGQQLSTRRDLLPVEFVDELTTLQDAAAPVRWDTAESVLARDLGRPVSEVFETIDPSPIAAASIAQVHAARLLDGSEVVVKLQRPGIESVVERDLDILTRLAGTLESRTEWGASIGLPDLAAGFADALREELDFTTERDNMRSVAASLDGAARPFVRIPAPNEDVSSSRVLVMERMRGTPLYSAEPVLAALGSEVRRRCATALLDSLLDQVLVHGAFHVDLHPGNVLVRADGALELLDFGSVGRLDSSTRVAIGALLAALGRGDSASATDMLLDLVDRPEEVNERELERSMGQLMVRYAGPGSHPGVAAFAALLRLVMTHRLRIPPEVAAVFRAFATLEGTLTLLDPDFDLLAQAQQSGRERLGEAMRPRQLRQAVEEELISVLPSLRRLPRRAERIVDSLEHGRLVTNVRIFADPRDRRWLTGLVHQALLTVIAGSTGMMAVLLLSIRGGPHLAGSAGVYDVLGYGLLVVAAVLGLRVLVAVFRQGPG